MTHVHWLKAEKDVHQFRYFLLMNTYCCLLMHMKIHTCMSRQQLIVCVSINWDKQLIEFGARIVGRNNLNWCTPFLGKPVC